MKSEDSIVANAASYITDIALHFSFEKEYNELRALYLRHKSDKLHSVVHMPKMWAPHVLKAVKDILSINHNVRFIDIREENSKLVLNLHYPGEYDENIRNRILRIKNFINIFTHAKLGTYEVQRKFTYETLQFY